MEHQTAFDHPPKELSGFFGPVDCAKDLTRQLLNAILAQDILTFFLGVRASKHHVLITPLTPKVT
jgi:hypothetical protein